ncbi:MAG: sorbosone dehydrogenase family protein [Ilumatobacter sp.]
MIARRRAAVLVTTGLVLSACVAGSDDDIADAPDVTLGTLPAPDESVDTTPSTEPVGTDQDTTTTSLVPSPDADLPTAAPDADPEPVPVTTLPGPLPEPAVRAIELGTFTRPVELAVSEGDPRLFVVQQGGQVVAADDESNTVVLDLATVPGVTFTSDGNEQGLLGLAFHPDADVAYVDFTNGAGNTVVAEFAVDALSGVFDPGSYREVLTVEQPFGNHNGGELAFGPDDLLYIGLGDGGSADDPVRAGLDPSTRLGKILRVDPMAADGAAFTVPADNPFVGVEGADPTIWSLGLRNPWRFSFDPLTGDLWIADVGQNQFEEINMAPAIDGRDAGRQLSFGWSAFEANERFHDDQSPDGHIAPVVAYEHTDGNCSVSGGAVARASTYADLNGWYVYGDYCSGRIWGLDTTSVSAGPDGPIGEPRVVELTNVPALAAIAEGPFGDIYAVSNAGGLFRLAPA